MFSASPVLLVDAIETLEQLASALSEGALPESPGIETAVQTEPLPPERRLGKELLLGIRVLLPKLRIARGLHTAGPEAQGEPGAQDDPGTQRGPAAPAQPYRVCTSCEE